MSQPAPIDPARGLLAAWVAALGEYYAAKARVATARAACAELELNRGTTSLTEYRAAIATYEKCEVDVHTYDIRCEVTWEEIGLETAEATSPIAEAVSGLFWLHPTTFAEIEDRVATGQPNGTLHDALSSYEAAAHALRDAKDLAAADEYAARHADPLRNSQVGKVQAAGYLPFQMCVWARRKRTAQESGWSARRAGMDACSTYDAVIRAYEDAGQTSELAVFRLLTPDHADSVDVPDQLEATIAAIFFPPARTAGATVSAPLTA